MNLNTVFTLCRDVGAYMLTREPNGDTNHRGSIINIASLVSFQGGLNVPAYAAVSVPIVSFGSYGRSNNRFQAKGGVAQLTKALSNQWAAQGINVNAVRYRACGPSLLRC